MKELLFNFKRIASYVKDNKKYLIKYVITQILEMFISIIIPVLSARVIIYLTDNVFLELVLISIVIFIVESINNWMCYLHGFYTSFISREMYNKLQTAVGKEILNLENKCIDSKSSGVFIQRLTSDINGLSDGVSALTSFLFGVITNIGVFVAVFFINKLVFIYFVLMMILLYILENKRNDINVKNNREFRKYNDKISGFAGEIIRCARDIKMLNATNSFVNKLHDEVTEFNQIRYKIQKTDRKYSLLINTIKKLMNLLLIILLISLIGCGYIKTSTALILVNYSSSIPVTLNNISNLLRWIKNFNLSANRVFEIMDSKNFVKEQFGKKHLNKVKGNFEFKNVSFAYNEKNVLNNLSFKVNANETVAFVGKSGSGKTTIFNLLCKMYDVNDGIITIDDININELDKDSIRGNMTIISQNPYLFNMSIKDNLKLVKEDITDKEIKEACKLACLDEFINELPDKYDTIIGEGGVNLSGGQKQRLAIARALIQKTKIILFDEATSALDNETQEKIVEALNNMKEKYTILIIAHRLSTIINADRIIYIENGKVIASGNHEQLLKNCKQYKKLYEHEIL